MNSGGPAKAGETPTYIKAISYELDLDLAFKDQLLLLCLSTLQGIQGDKAMPSRQDFDPLKLPVQLLPHIMLIDASGTMPIRLRWRLVGTYITERIGRDMTGRFWDEIYEDKVLREMSKAPLWAIEHRRPIRSIGGAPTEEKEFLVSENIFAPLSTDGETVDMLFAVSVLT